MYNERMPDIELPGGKYGHRDQTSPQTYGRLLKGYLQTKRDGALGFELMWMYFGMTADAVFQN